MPKVEIIGFAPSTYVRVVRMACEEKGIDYELESAPPHSPRAGKACRSPGCPRAGARHWRRARDAHRSRL